MKKRRFAQLVLMITMLFCLTFGTVCAQAATTATTTTAVKNGWKKEGGKYYGFNRYAQMVKGVYYSAYGQSRAGFYAFVHKNRCIRCQNIFKIKESICKRKEFCSTAESPWQTSSYQKDRWLLW